MSCRVIKCKNKKISKVIYDNTVFVAVLCAIPLIITCSDTITHTVINTAKLCFTKIVPSLFPLMIVSDVVSSINVNGNNIIGKLFSKFTGVSSSGLKTFILGCLCGAPIGVKCAVELYRNGNINKSECETLIGISNNLSPGFIISAVGAGLFGSLRLGILLYFSVLLSTFSVSVLFRNSGQKSTKTNVVSRQRFVLRDSVSNAAFSCITISAFVVFFSILISLAEIVTRSMPISVLVALLLEAGNATVLLSQSGYPQETSLILTAISLGFSGFSIHLQAESFIPEEISRKKYYLIKFVEAILAGLIMFVCVKML